MRKIESLFFETEEELYYSGKTPLLPEWYNFSEFKNDILAMFSQRPYYRLGKKNLELIYAKSANFQLEEWARIQRFYVKFPKTELYREILKHIPDPYEASRWFISLLTARWENLSEKGEVGLGDLLSLVLKEGNNPSFDIPFLLGGGVGKGRHLSIKYLKKALKVQKALSKLMLKYRGASEISVSKIETLEPCDDTEPRQICSLSELPTVLPSELALPDSIFFLKAVKKELHRLQHYQYQKHPRKYVMLLDVSGSMSDNEKYIFATASAIALIKNAIASGINEAIIVPFDDDVHDHIAGNAHNCISKLMDIPFSGGGTNIDKAIQHADNLDCDEIIIITDGEDEVSYIPQHKLYTVFCSGSNEFLHQISYSYEEIDAGKEVL